MVPKFDQAIREAIVLREDFANSLREAMDNASSVDDLKKILNVTARFGRVCSGLQQDAAKKMEEFDDKTDSTAGDYKSAINQEKPPITALSANSVTPVPQLASNSVPDNASLPPAGKITQQTDPGAKSVSVSVSGAKKTLPEAPVDLEKVRVKPDRPSEFLRNVQCARVFFNYLNPDTTEDSLRTQLTQLQYDVVQLELFQWSNKKSRGTAMVSLKDAGQALDMINQHSIEIDGWTVAPKIMLADLPTIASIDPIPEELITSEKTSTIIPTKSANSTHQEELPGRDEGFDLISSGEFSSSPDEDL